MQLTYRGVQYSKHSTAKTMAVTEHDAIYRGVPYRLKTSLARAFKHRSGSSAKACPN